MAKQIEMTLSEYQDMMNQRVKRRAESLARRRSAGRKGNAEGDAFQTRLDIYHQQLLDEGRLVKIQRQYPPMKSLWATLAGGRQSLVFVPTGKGPVDYLFATPDGKLGLFDAKTSDSKNTFTWPATTAHQLEELRDLRASWRTNAYAFALVFWREYSSVRIHTIESIDGRTVRRLDGFEIVGVRWLDSLIAEKGSA